MGFFKSKVRSSLGKSLFGLLIYVLLLVFFAKGDESAIPVSKNEYLQSYTDLMKSSMNFTVEPCHDFYEYACGNYRKNSKTRQLFHGGNRLNDVVKHLESQTEHLLDRMDLAESLNVSKELKVAQRFYNACLEADLYPFPATDPHYLTLIRSIGGFPAVDGANWNASNFSWFNMSAHMTNFGAEGLFREYIADGPTFKAGLEIPELGFDSIIQRDEFGMISSHIYRLNEQRMSGYLESYQLPEDKIAEVIEEVFTFLRKALWVAERNQYYWFRTPCKSFELANYFDIAWNLSISQTKCHSYLVEMDELCSRHPEAAANYLAMKLLYTFDAKLNATKDREDYCKTTLTSSMSFLFKKMLKAEYFYEETKLEVSEMVEKLRRNIRKLAEEPDMMSPEDRNRTLGREKSMVSHIGSFEDNNSLNDVIIQKINHLEIDGDSYAATSINLQRYNAEIKRFIAQHFEELYRPGYHEPLLRLDIQAVYEWDYNTIYVLTGILQPPQYHHFWPLSLKLGTLGYFVGKELIYGFKEIGSHSRTCFTNGYTESFSKNSRSLYLVEVVAEDTIADSGALSWSLKQLLEDPRKERITERMPGLNLLPEQLFFLGFAQTYCSDFEEDHYNNLHKERVLGALANNKDFLEAFNCPAGSAMRSASKNCSIW